MFPLSHTYVSTRVLKRQTPNLVFGSVLPDIATTSKNNIGRDKIHYSPNEFLSFVKSKYPELIDIAIGVNLHSHINKGADYYSDDSTTGFAYTYGKNLVSKVKHLLKIEDDTISLVLSHNLIEAGVDINLLRKNPEVLEIYTNGFQKIDKEKIVSCLSEYLALPKDTLKLEIDNFITFLGPESISSVDTIIDRVAIPLIQLRFNCKVDRGETVSIISEAARLMEREYIRLLDQAVRGITSSKTIEV